jgi:hypothetical protein
MAADIQALHDQIEREIGLTAKQIREREEHIAALKQENVSAEARIDQLREALSALQKIKALGPLLGDSPARTPKLMRIKKKKAPSLRPIVLPMLEEAGRAGMTDTEIERQISERVGWSLGLSSIRIFLYRARTDGLVEKHGKRLWRSIATQPAATVAENPKQTPITHEVPRAVVAPTFEEISQAWSDTKIDESGLIEHVNLGHITKEQFAEIYMDYDEALAELGAKPGSASAAGDSGV